VVLYHSDLHTHTPSFFSFYLSFSSIISLALFSVSLSNLRCQKLTLHVCQCTCQREREIRRDRLSLTGWKPVSLCACVCVCVCEWVSDRLLTKHEWVRERDRDWTCWEREQIRCLHLCVCAYLQVLRDFLTFTVLFYWHYENKKTCSFSRMWGDLGKWGIITTFRHKKVYIVPKKLF